jgi:flagellum-specific peptidoglycan hydrolase FlgJ
MRSSFEDHALVLKRQWPQAFITKDPIEFTKLLVQSPPKYATASNYVDEISKIIAGYDRLQNAKPASLELTGTTTQPDTLISL